MEFNRSFEDILKSVERIFDKADVPTTKMYRSSPDYDKLCDYCEGSIREGLTKFVFNLNECDNFVVKIPFSGIYSTWFSENDEDKYEEMRVNHCQRELEDYRDLKDSEIGFLLVPTYYVGKINELEIYIQPKVETYSYSKHTPSKDAYRVASELEYYECTADDEETIAAFVDAFGDDAQSILSMLDNYGVRDLHSGNFGYLDNELVIFDYCGYHN